MKSRCTAGLFLILATLSFHPLHAQQLVTFSDGQPARASEVNANFSALLAEIQTLKTQVAALQAQTGGASIVGTWDVYNLDGTTFSSSSGGFYMENAGGKGVATFSADGTYTLSSPAFKSSLSVNNNISLVSLPGGATALKSLVSASASNGPDTDAGSSSGTYSVSGNTLTVGTQTFQITRDGTLIFFFQADASGIQLIIFVKR
jgi:prophage DNA circulation protein